MSAAPCSADTCRQPRRGLHWAPVDCAGAGPRSASQCLPRDQAQDRRLDLRPRDRRERCALTQQSAPLTAQIFFSSNVTASQVIGRVASAAASLRKKGARAFLIGAEYGFDEAPFAANASSSDKALYANYARDLRARAQKLVNELKQDGSKAALLDFYTVTQQAFEDPAKYGFAAKYRQVACLQGAYGGTRSLCTNPDKHLWWDDVRRRHRCALKLAVPPHDARAPATGRRGRETHRIVVGQAECIWTLQRHRGITSARPRR